MSGLTLGLLSLALALACAGDSPPGLKGTTIFRVTGGAAGHKPTNQVMRIPFAIAPVRDDKPEYGRALFCTSDTHGSYTVSLTTGKYWIGPPAKARDPEHYNRWAGAQVVEQIVVVGKQGWTHLDIVEVVEAH